MSEQINPGQIRELLKMSNGIFPILNQEEYTKLAIFFSNVLIRYENEHYPNGLEEENNK